VRGGVDKGQNLKVIHLSGECIKPEQAGVEKWINSQRCTSGNFRGFEKPTVRPQLVFFFVRAALSWFSKK
jgi:hypothetical protein